jgi:hypothetical protein
MAQTGWQLAADLSDLKVIGVVDLPMLAYTYAAANQSVHATSDTDPDAFARPGGGGWDDVYATWTGLRNQLQDAFGNTANILEDLGATMVHVVDAYTATDTQAATSLASQWKDGPPGLNSLERQPEGPPPAVTIS